jgi:hypothetical protein
MQNESQTALLYPKSAYWCFLSETGATFHKMLLLLLLLLLLVHIHAPTPLHILCERAASVA